MNDSFNPYHEWLGIDAKIARPDFYQLFELEPFESDLGKISHAAERAATRVRSFRPGQHAAQWAKLLDEINLARRSLTTTAEKEVYDNQLRSSNGNGSASQNTYPSGPPENSKTTSADIRFEQASDKGRTNYYPPGFSNPNAAPAPQSGAVDIPTTPISPTSPVHPTYATPASYPSVPSSSVAAAQAYYPPGMTTPSPAVAGANGGALGPQPMSTYSQPGMSDQPGTVILPPHANPMAGGPLGGSAYGHAMSPAMSPYARGPSATTPMAPNPMTPNPMAPVGFQHGGVPMPANPTGPMGHGPMGHGPMGQAYGQSPYGGGMPNPMAPAYTTPGIPQSNPMSAAPLPLNPMAPMTSSSPYAMPGAMPQHGMGGAAMNPQFPQGGIHSPMGAPQALMAAAPSSVPVAQLVQAPAGAHVQVAMGIPISGQAPSITAGSMSTAPTSSPLAASTTPATPAIRTPSTAAVLRAERSRNAIQTPIILGVAGGLVMLTVAIVYYAMGGISARDELRNVATNSTGGDGQLPRDFESPNQGKDPQTNPPPARPNGETPTFRVPPPRNNDFPPKKNEKANRPSDDTMENDPAVMPSSNKPVSIIPKPEPIQPPVPVVKPTPTPTPIPIPTPEPKPEPVKPPEKMPKREEVAALATALQKAHLELSELNLTDAEKTLQTVEKLTMLREHAEKLERLKQLIHYNQEFLRAMREAAKGFEAGATITIGNTVAAIVETFPNQDKIILRIAGMNRTYEFRNMPVGLAVAIANEWLDKKAPSSLVIKSCFVMTSKKSNEDTHKKAKEWLNEAKRDLGDVVTIVETAFVDDYDLLKDFKE